MKSLLKTLLVCCLSLPMVARSQDAPKSATELVEQATQKAGKDGKHVLIMFHASWCGWCHKMDSSINDPACKKFFEDNYVIQHLTVDESPDKKNLENPGASELREKYHGDGEGIPFWLVLDSKGHLIADSQIRPEGASLDTKGENVGCPTEAKEIEYFVAILKKSSNLNAGDEQAIRKRFGKNAN